MKKVFLPCLFFALAFNASASGGREASKHSQPPPPGPSVPENARTLLGSIVMFGNEPFSFAGIVEENGAEYAVYPRERREELRLLQGHLIEFTVLPLDETQRAQAQATEGVSLGGGWVMLYHYRIVH